MLDGNISSLTYGCIHWGLHNKKDCFCGWEQGKRESEAENEIRFQCSMKVHRVLFCFPVLEGISHHLCSTQFSISNSIPASLKCKGLPKSMETIKKHHQGNLRGRLPYLIKIPRSIQHFSFKQINCLVKSSIHRLEIETASKSCSNTQSIFILMLYLLN